jgi:hypothetical protein
VSHKALARQFRPFQLLQLRHFNFWRSPLENSASYGSAGLALALPLIQPRARGNVECLGAIRVEEAQMRVRQKGKLFSPAVVIALLLLTAVDVNRAKRALQLYAESRFLEIPCV